MKEVKFRGKRVDNGAWVYGVPYAEYMICGTATAYYDDEVPMSKYVEFDYKEVDPVTVGQCTGLKDKNGREIYEGDMLRVIDPNGEENRLCIVEWDAEAGCYSYEPDGGYGDFDVSAIGWAMSMEFEFEIIGNIHDNPELLGGAKA